MLSVLCPLDAPVACKGIYTIKQTDMDTGFKENEFYISYTGPEGSPVERTAASSLLLPGSASIAIGECGGCSCVQEFPYLYTPT